MAKRKKLDDFYGPDLTPLLVATQKYYNQKVSDWILRESFFRGGMPRPKLHWYQTWWLILGNRIYDWRRKLGELIAGEAFSDWDD